MIVNTVGELKAALAEVDDATPLARGAHIGGFWVTGQLQVGTVELVEIGRLLKDREIVRTDDRFFSSWKAWRGKPFQALALGG